MCGAEMTENAGKTNGAEAKNPSEVEPCLEDSKRPEKSNFFRKYRDEIGERSGLSRKGVYVVGAIVVLAFVLLVVVVALGAAWPRLPHELQFPVCKKAECLRAAAQIQEALDSSLPICDNLWNATCGGWLKKYPLPKEKSVWNMKQQLVRREAERVRDMVATLKLPLHTSTVQWKLKHLYEGCVNVENVRSDDARQLKNIINELGGWYILRDFNDADFDKNEVLKTLHVQHGVTPFFKISVQPNPNMPGQNAIRISPSGLGLPDREYYYRDQNDPVQIAYMEYIRDIVIYMSTARNEATKFGRDMFFYEKRIAEITPETLSLQNPITTYNAISLSELRDTNTLPFFDILQAMYPESNITENTEVIVTSLDYLGQISQIIATTDRKTMNGYLTWTLVRHYVPYLSSDYTSALDTFTYALYGTQQPLERWEMCAGLVRRFMGFAVNFYEEENHPLTNDSIRVIDKIFASIVSVVKNKIEKFRQTPLLYNHLRNKLSTVSLQVGLPENTKQEKYLKDYYLKLKIMKLNLFESAQNSIDFLKKLEERRLNKSPAEDSFLSYALEEIPRVEYSPSDNTVIVPRSLLTEPFFEENYPSAIIYGRLGVEIAEAVVSSTFPYDSLWTADRKILSPYHMTVDESIRSAQPSLKCIENYIANSNWSPNQASNETSLKTLIHVIAVDVAREALQSSLEQAEHIHQPSLEQHEDAALFFIAYSQTQCSEATSQQQLYDNIVNFELPQSLRLHLVRDQLSAFAGSLGCSFDKSSQCRDIF